MRVSSAKYWAERAHWLWMTQGRRVDGYTINRDDTRTIIRAGVKINFRIGRTLMNCIVRREDISYV